MQDPHRHDRAIVAALRSPAGDRPRRGTFEGFLCFSDPVKPQAIETVRALAERGVRIKIVSGDNRYVAAHVGATVGLDPRAVEHRVALPCRAPPSWTPRLHSPRRHLRVGRAHRTIPAALDRKDTARRLIPIKDR